MKFADLDLRPEIIQAIDAMGFTDATAIQATVIPHILKGKDVSGLAQTGTGKTGAFVIPLLDRLLRARSGEIKEERVFSDWKPNNYILVLVPTRELATQVEETIVNLGKFANVKSVVVAGGNSYEDQKKALHSGVEFVVSTPGRLLDLYKSHDVDLNGVRAIVFDEADRMFDMGFRDDMKFILRRVPRNRQLLLFSATLNFEVINTAYQFGAEPIEFNVSRDQATAEGIDHEILHVGHHEKPMYLLSILKKNDPKQCIVFSNFKSNVGKISKFLKNNGIEATAMSSLLSQAQRNKVLEAFKTGKKAILVATDVAARGLDIKGVDLVINFELPDDSEGYVHRIGRTGRAGTSGRAVGLVCDRDVEALGRIENYLKEKLKVGWYEDSELVKEFQPFPTHDDEEESRPFRPAPTGRSQGGRDGRPSQNRSRAPRNHDKPVPGGNRPLQRHGQNRSQGGGHPQRQEQQGQRAFSGQHRDRHSGRHRPQHSANGQHRGQHQQNPRYQNTNQHRQQQHHHHHSSLKRRPLTGKSATSGPAGLSVVSKLKKLIKGLFS